MSEDPEHQHDEPTDETPDPAEIQRQMSEEPQEGLSQQLREVTENPEPE